MLKLLCKANLQTWTSFFDYTSSHSSISRVESVSFSPPSIVPPGGWGSRMLSTHLGKAEFLVLQLSHGDPLCLPPLCLLPLLRSSELARGPLATAKDCRLRPPSETNSLSTSFYRQTKRSVAKGPRKKKLRGWAYIQGLAFATMYPSTRSESNQVPPTPTLLFKTPQYLFYAN